MRNSLINGSDREALSWIIALLCTLHHSMFIFVPSGEGSLLPPCSLVLILIVMSANEP